MSHSIPNPNPTPATFTMALEDMKEILSQQVVKRLFFKFKQVEKSIQKSLVDELPNLLKEAKYDMVQPNASDMPPDMVNVVLHGYTNKALSRLLQITLQLENAYIVSLIKLETPPNLAPPQIQFSHFYQLCWNEVRLELVIQFNKIFTQTVKNDIYKSVYELMDTTFHITFRRFLSLAELLNT